MSQPIEPPIDYRRFAPLFELRIRAAYRTIHDAVGYAILRTDWETGTISPPDWDDEPASDRVPRTGAGPTS